MDRPGLVERDPDPRFEPRDAPEIDSLPEPEQPQYGDGVRRYEPVQPRSGLGDLARKLVAPIVAFGLLILKFGGLLLKLKVFTTGASMLVSIAAYAWIWGLPFAIGFVLLIFVHELGHVLELRRQGVPASAPLFIPFLGAVIGMKDLPDDAWKEARVALAGPILGSVGAAAAAEVSEVRGLQGRATPGGRSREVAGARDEGVAALGARGPQAGDPVLQEMSLPKRGPDRGDGLVVRGRGRRRARTGEDEREERCQEARGSGRWT